MLHTPTVSNRYAPADVEQYYAAGCRGTDTFGTLRLEVARRIGEPTGTGR